MADITGKADAGTLDGDELLYAVDDPAGVPADKTTTPSAIATYVDAAGAAASAVSTHSADTTSVHGIADTSALLDTGDIGVSVAAEGHTHTLSDVTDSGTAAALNVPAAGDAASGEVVKGDDTRLTDARTPTSHNHAGEDITSGTVAAARLGTMTGDSGAGGAKGAVPAPGAGDAAAGKYLKADGTWATVSAGLGGSTGATDKAALVASGPGGSTVQATPTLIDPTTGAITVPAGSTSSTPYLKAAGASGGIYGDSNFTKISSSSGSVQFVVANGSTSVRAIGLGSDPDSPDGYIATIGKDSGNIPILRAGTSVVGTGAPGNFGCKFPFEANTATSGAPNVLGRDESRTVFTNEGATAKNYHTLPSPFQGYEYTFICQDSDGIRITAASGDTIRIIDKVTSAAGYIETTTIGSVVRLVSLNAAEWFAVAIHGTWTDGTFTYDDTSLTTP